MNTYERRSCINPNDAYPDVDLSTRTRFDFVGVGRWNRGKPYREYGETVDDAVLAVCTSYRLSPKDIQLVKK